jgi:hypothetical protein
MSRYRFVCRSCKYECISEIGKVVEMHSYKVPMTCKACSTVGTYTIPKSGSPSSEMSKRPTCVSCHSSEHLSEWDCLTCPHCNSAMRALGSDVDAEKPYRYW